MDKELILAALKEAGLSEELIDQITAENEEELATQVAELKKKADKPSLTSLLEEAGLDGDLKTTITDTVKELVQSETDRRVTQAIEKVTKKMSKGKGPGDEGDSEQMSELNKKIDALTEALTGQQQQQEQQRLRGLAAAALEKKGLPKKWLGRVQVEKEDQIEGAINELESEFQEIKQNTLDEIIKNSPVPGLSLGTGGDLSKSKIDKYVEETEREGKQTNIVKLETGTD